MVQIFAKGSMQYWRQWNRLLRCGWVYHELKSDGEASSVEFVFEIQNKTRHY